MKKSLIMFFTLFMCWFSTNNAWSVELGEVNIHGYISQGYIKSTDYDYMVTGTEDGTFQFNETGINFSTFVTRQLRIGMQMIALDLGDIGNDEIKMDWVYGDYRWQDYLGLRVGILKIPHGFYNETRDVDMLRVPIFLPAGIYNELYRDFFTRMKGVGTYGVLPGGILYNFQYGVSMASKDGGLARKGGSRLLGGVCARLDNEDMFTGSIHWETPLDGLKLGVTSLKVSAQTEFDMGNSSFINVDFQGVKTLVGSAEYNIYDFTFAAEYVKSDINYTIDIGPTTTEYTTRAYYGSVAYIVNDWLQMGCYYSHRFKNSERNNPDEYIKDLALSLRFDINPYWVAKLEGHKMKGFNTVESTDTDDRDWFFYAAKMTYSF